MRGYCHDVRFESVCGAFCLYDFHMLVCIQATLAIAGNKAVYAGSEKHCSTASQNQFFQELRIMDARGGYEKQEREDTIQLYASSIA